MDIISKKTRRAFADYLVSFSVLRQIEAYFDDHDIKYLLLEENEQQSGERRGLIYGYYKSVNWENWQDVSKIVSVFETILNDIPEEIESYKSQKNRITKFLESDGFYLEQGKLIYQSNFPLSENPALNSTELLNKRQLKLHIQRIESSINNDPDLAIGNAKELIETICKNILDNEMIEYSKNNDLPQLMKLVSKELKITPEDISDEAKGSEIIKRLLSNLSTVANGITELRNLYGTGHGKNKHYTSLEPRHARLVAGASFVLSNFIVETYQKHKELI